jgi:protein gp37
MSKIEWTEVTWNPCTGCSKISEGCKHCYAAIMARRLRGMGQPNYINGFDLTVHPEVLEKPARIKKPSTIFVNSMSDTFHKDIPDEFIKLVFDVMKNISRHEYQVLTKRPDRLAKLAPELPWPENIWMGVTVESEKYVGRIEHLRTTPAKIRFLSLEPLLSPIPNLDLTGIDWVIAGGESGPGARPMNYEWVTSIRDQCVESGIPYFFKQWGNIRNNPDKNDPTHKKNGGKSKGGRLIDGKLWDEMPQRITQGGRNAPR